MTRDQYHHLVANYDKHRYERLVAQIDPRINRAGKLYRKKLQAIREEVYGTRTTNQPA